MRFRLNADPAALRGQYVSARPVPHIVLDNLFPNEVLEEVLDDFPRPDEIAWRKFDNPTEKKLGYWHENPLRPRIQLFLYEMNSAPLLQFLEALTGIEGLVSDPYY
ncbi:MAG: 2OG-Fe(II) oxygenase, partial [Thermoanaerobaculia bacterium]